MRERLRHGFEADGRRAALDLFYPEDEEYARRLNEAGVTCEFDEVEGAYHAFEGTQPRASVSAAFLARSLEALRRGLRLR